MTDNFQTQLTTRITNFKNAVINKIDARISTHNENPSAHQDIRTTLNSHTHSFDTSNLATGAVTSDKIANGTIINEDINNQAGIETSKILHTTASNRKIDSIVNATLTDGSNMLQADLNTHINERFSELQDMSYTQVTSLGNTPNNNFNVNGSVTFIKLHKIVICQMMFSFTSHNTPQGNVFVCNIPEDYIPASFYRQNTSDTAPYLICSLSDATTKDSRDSYVQAYKENDVFKLYVSSANTSTSMSARGQIVWVTD